MSMPGKRSRIARSGNALLESALVLSIAIYIFVGIADFAQFLFIHQSLVERTNDAVRWAIVNPYDPTAISNMVMYQQATPPQQATPAFGLTSQMIVVERIGAGLPEDRIKVTVKDYPFVFLSPLIAGAVKGLPIQAAMPYENP
jgi:hypothetical protein